METINIIWEGLKENSDKIAMLFIIFALVAFVIAFAVFLPKVVLWLILLSGTSLLIFGAIAFLYYEVLEGPSIIESGKKRIARKKLEEKESKSSQS